MHKPTFNRAVKFGEQLLHTGDLDPVYIAIYNTMLTETQRNTLLVSYWCTYHLGAAAYIAEKSTTDARFWNRLRDAAANDGWLRYPRGSERRHWRGEQAMQSYESLRKRFYNSTHLVEWLLQTEPTRYHTFSTIMQRTQTCRGFGPWIAFKVADMLERCVAPRQIRFDAHLDLYEEPLKGAGLIYHGSVQRATKTQLQLVSDALMKRLNKHMAPPTKCRRVNEQEVETVLCKFKSHYNGHYPVGKDIHEVREGLDGWGDLAQQLREGLDEGTKEVT